MSHICSQAFPSLGGGGKRLQNLGPRPQKRQKVVFIQPKKSWTHDFCLLSGTDQITTPNLRLLSTLKEAGLGKKRIVFPNKNADFSKLKTVLETEYPQLKSQDGAFELMRAEGGGYSRPLCLIPIPSNGYSIPYLKDMVGSNTTIYIRPIKTSLSLKKAATSVSPGSPLTECTTCKEQVPIFSLREHSASCSSTNNDGDVTTIPDDSENDELDVFEDSDDGSVSDMMRISQNATIPQSSLSLPSSSKSQPGLNIFLSDLPSTSAQCWLSDLKDAFPDEDDKTLEDIASVAISIDQAACLLLDKKEETKENLPLEELIDKFVEKNQFRGDESILVDRETFWLDVVKFYKKALSKPDILRKELYVAFDGEEGLDGGAMKIEFFTLALNEIKARLFEGAERNMVPIKDATKGILFQLAGVVISRAFLQRSSIGFPYLAPHIYSQIVEEEEDEIATQMKKEHIPLDASTALLHEFLTALENCTTDEDVHALLEENVKNEAYWQIINSSRWPKEKIVDISSKEFLLQHLIFHELLVSRKNEIEEFSDGLKHLSFLDFLRKHKETCKVLFTGAECQPITVDSLKEMIINVETKSFSERQAHEWFLAYLNEDEDEDFPVDSRLRALLQFWTGWTIIPFGGLVKRLKVVFLPDDDTKTLPTTSSCTALLRIPTVHSSKKGFFKSMNIALKFGSVGFPNP